MTIRESAIERKCMRWARDQGALDVKIQGTRGWPDRLVVMPNGRAMFVEFKRPGQIPDPLQKHVLGELRKRGVVAVWVDSMTGFVAAFERNL